MVADSQMKPNVLADALGVPTRPLLPPRPPLDLTADNGSTIGGDIGTRMSFASRRGCGLRRAAWLARHPADSVDHSRPAQFLVSDTGLEPVESRRGDLREVWL